MKKTIIFSLVMLIVFLTTNAQPPQGINYQAVAYGPGGPLSNHSVSLRLSIIDSSSSGTAVYVETQSTTTDTTGLFSVVIGMGTPVTGTFSSISWGVNNKWLKTEIDTTGGSSYLLMGVTQFMSVPYALYAGQSAPSSVSVEYPDGLDSITPIFLGSSLNYIVPAGKSFYVTSIHNDIDRYLLIDGDTLNYNFIVPSQFPFTFSAGTHIQQNSTTTIAGFLVNQKVSWVYINPLTPYTVPSGEILFVRWCISNAGQTGDNIIINGTNLGAPTWYTSAFPFIVDQNQTISFSTTQGSFMRLIGYLKNK